MSKTNKTPETSTLPEELGRIDLNILVAFDALVRERSVTNAARRMGVTQSAMSHTLRRLRELLGDPLLVRGRGGMVLTPRAEALAIPLRSGLVTLGRALSTPQHFEPASAQRAFRLASIDIFDVLALPRLLECTRRDAPGVDIAVVSANSRTLSDALETGELDMAVMPSAKTQEQANLPLVNSAGLLQRTLFHDGFSCFIRGDHPALDPSKPDMGWNLELYASLSHAMVSPTGSGIGLVDQLLGERGLKRRIALRLPLFYSAPTIIAESDLVLTAPTTLNVMLPENSPLIMLPSPLPLPNTSVVMMWHQRFSDDPGHRWLREVIVEIANGLPIGV